MAELQGYSQLQARLHAMSASTPALMKTIGLQVVREAKLEVHRKTGNLGRSIHVSGATATHATVVASANYAAFVELGTRAHVITPRAAKALRWAASPGGARLTGSPRKGAAVLFAKVVHHPGSKPYPFLLPAARKVAAMLRLSPIIDAWNKAA
jgi:hypothetical protein